MKILAIDTSTNVLGVGVISEDKVIGEYITNIKRNHSTRVLPAVNYLLQDCGISINDIDKIAVAKGPGSYTGIRIGVTIAKTLAWTLKVPLVGVSTLRLMAATPRYFNGYIVPVIDARRGNIYTGLYEYQNNELVQVIEDHHNSAEEFSRQLADYGKPCLLIGEDASIHQDVFAKNLSKNLHLSTITNNIPRPGEMGLMARDIKEEEIHTFVPNYIRLAEAEMKWREKTGK